MLCAFALVLGTHLALAQSYPNKPIRVIVPFPPGGAADAIVRLIEPGITERMGQPLVVENRAGASGQIGLQLLKNAAPDGYTLGMGVAGNLSIAPHTYKELPYDPLKDFAPIALNATSYAAVIAHPAAPFRTAAEMIAWAKANPGRLAVATNGDGGYPHLAFEYLAKMSGFSFVQVPYKGDPQAVADVIGNQVPLGIGAYPSFFPHIESGRVRLIGVTHPVRVPDRPELPIFADLVPGYGMRGWFGLLAPAGTPRGIVLRLNEEINRALNAPGAAGKLVASGLIIATGSPEFFAEFIRADHAKVGKLVRDIGFQPQ
jgi:tripartite-type tricarboxylate transporter receptor subunit TctC